MPKLKHTVIYRHKHPVQLIYQFFGVSRSGYYDFVKRIRIGQPEHDVDLAESIRECQKIIDKTYGYRRVRKWLQG